MNSIKIFFSCCIVFGFLSCSEDDPGKYADYLVARPLTITLQEFKNGVEVVSPQAHC